MITPLTLVIDCKNVKNFYIAYAHMNINMKAVNIVEKHHGFEPMMEADTEVFSDFRIVNDTLIGNDTDSFKEWLKGPAKNRLKRHLDYSKTETFSWRSNNFCIMVSTNAADSTLVIQAWETQGE